MAESTTAYTRESLRPYYKTNPEPRYWTQNNKRYQELNGCDPDNTIKIAAVFAGIVVAFIAASAVVGIYARPNMGCGGYYTLMIFMAAGSVAFFGLFVLGVREVCQEQKKHEEERAELQRYFKTPLEELDLRVEMKYLDPNHMNFPKKLKSYIKEKT